jgi:alkylhydroperoxidase family enzyme
VALVTGTERAGTTGPDLAPDAAAAWARVLGALPGALDPATTAALAVVVGDALGVPVEDVPGPAVPAATLDPAVRAFAEQFVVDVSATTPSARDAATGALGADAFPTVQVLYVLDLGTRLAAAWQGFLGAPLAVEPAGGPDLWPALESFMRTVALRDALDPVTTEIVRLRGARAHDCRLCRSIRSAPAARAGGDEDLYTRIDGAGAPLDERHRLALEVVDTMLWQPASPAPRLALQVVSAFTPSETAEILLDVVRNAANKIAVAFGADDPHVTEGVEYFDVDELGDLVYGVTPR